MSNSPLATYRRPSPDRDHPRTHKIDTITIHCYIGQVTARQGCDYFARTDREASANYVVGYDGSIGVSVDEGDRSWCSANAENDHRAVTIEVACERQHPYQVTKEAYQALIALVADVCRRNHIEKLRWQADESLIGQVERQNMTVHRWFAATACPGKYLYDRMGRIASEVNERLGVEEKVEKIRRGDMVRIVQGACWYGGGSVPDWVREKKWRVSELSGVRAVLDEGGINSPIHVKYLRKVGAPYKPRKVKMQALELPDVRLGDRTAAARRAMMLLRDRGFLPEDTSCAPGAVFDEAAVAVVKAFQKKNGLTVDGWIGSRTWRELIAG